MQCKRILCALLASLMILPLAACGNTEEDTGTSTSTANAATDAETGEETKATLDLPEKRFDDFELTFITRDEAEWSTVEIIPDTTSDFVNIAEAVTERNEILKSQYGVTLKELKTRRPDKKNPYRARVVVVGSEVDDIDFIKLVEETGAYVCADRFCYGSFPGRDPIVLTDDEDALTQICRQYMNRAQCPRYMNMPKMIGRREYVNQLAKEYEADGIIYEQIKFCDPWAYERMLGSHILNDDYGYPVLSVDRPYNIASSGQMRTRVQAFVESMEIKKIQGGKQ